MFFLYRKESRRFYGSVVDNGDDGRGNIVGVGFAFKISLVA